MPETNCPYLAQSSTNLCQRGTRLGKGFQRSLEHLSGGSSNRGGSLRVRPVCPNSSRQRF